MYKGHCWLETPISHSVPLTLPRLQTAQPQPSINSFSVPWISPWQHWGYCTCEYIEYIKLNALNAFPPALKGLHSLLLLQLQQPQSPLESTAGRIPCRESRAQGWAHPQGWAEHPWVLSLCSWDGDRVIPRDFLPGHPMGCEAGTENVPMEQPGEETLSKRAQELSREREKIQESGLEAKDWWPPGKYSLVFSGASAAIKVSAPLGILIWKSANPGCLSGISDFGWRDLIQEVADVLWPVWIQAGCMCKFTPLIHMSIRIKDNNRFSKRLNSSAQWIL